MGTHVLSCGCCGFGLRWYRVQGCKAQGDLSVLERKQSVVRDGHAVSVTAEIVEHILRTTKRWFGIDDPIFAKQRPEPRGEDLRFRE